MSIDLSLHRIRALMSCFPPYTRPTVHIAGTNGKGSVSAILSAIFLSTDPPLTVGRFNSPHLVSVLDSITLDSKSVSSSLYASTREEVEQSDMAAGIGASNFELLTTTALLIFERARVDVVVCEVGMGGRLDATNVIPDAAVLVSVITSVDLDHQAFLGNSVAAIAREKAGIARPRTPVILSPQTHWEVVSTVEDIATTVQAELVLAPLAADRPWDVHLDGPIPTPFSLNPFRPPPPRPVEVKLTAVEESLRLLLPLHGDHQLANLGTALAVMATLRSRHIRATVIGTRISLLPNEVVYRAVRECVWPGRLSFFTYTPHEVATPSREGHLTIIADGAHNTASSKSLAYYISSVLSHLSSTQPSPNYETKLKSKMITLTYILALSHSPPKTPADILEPLLSSSLQMSSSLSLELVAKVKIAVLRFTPPAGMPWVTSVAPSHLQAVAQTFCPEAELWTAPDDLTGDASDSLRRALQWASQPGEGDDERKSECLAIVAGSLYLVADLYRVLASPVDQQ